MRNFEDLQIAVAGTGYGSVELSRWSSFVKVSLK